MRTLILAAALVAVSLPAMAQQSASPPKNASTAEFVKKAAITNMFEIQAGQLALEKSNNPKVDDYANLIIKDHQQAQSELQSKAQAAKSAPVPNALDQAHQKKIDQLKSASGAVFMKTFKSQQVQGHKEAVALFQAYAKNGDNADLKQWAQTTTPKLQTHLKHAESLPTSAAAPTTGSGR